MVDRTDSIRRGRIMAHFQRGRQCPPPLRALLLPVAQRVLHTSVDQIHHGSQDGTLGDPGCRDCNRTHNRHSEILLILKILDVLQDKQQHQRSCEPDKDARHSLTSLVDVFTSCQIAHAGYHEVGSANLRPTADIGLLRPTPPATPPRPVNRRARHRIHTGPWRSCS